MKYMDQAKKTAFLIGSTVRLGIPSVLKLGEKFTLKIRVTGPDALPVESFPFTFLFEDCEGVEGLPSEFRMPGTGWSADIQGLTATGPELARIRARIPDSGKTCEGDPVLISNPAWVFEEPDCRIYWGDIHIHTNYSNCHAWECLDPEWAYLYARDVSLLDFAAPADHIRGIASDSARWPRLQQLSAQFNSPGEFVSMLAYESSHAQGFGGDNNVYFLDDDAPYFWLDRDDMRGAAPKVTLEQLWEQMDDSGKEYFTVPHHTGRGGKYRTWTEDSYNPDKEPLFEIYSSWGSSEFRWNRYPMHGGNNDDVSYFSDALKAGTRFGLIASSDDHATLPGSVHRHRGETFESRMLGGFHHKGLAAVFMPELSRKALFNSLKTRNCYASTHDRSLLDIRLAGARMGEEINADGALKKSRSIECRFTVDRNTVSKAELFRNAKLIDSRKMSGSGIEKITFTDDSDLDSKLVRNAKFHPEPFAVYYLRVTSTNGSCVWSSPVWIDG